MFVGLAALINVWLERRIIGRIQVRRGPNRVGPFGLLQPLADAIKLIQKEVLQPRAADNKLFNLPPVLVFIPAMLSFAVFAWAPDMVYADLNVGVLYVLALSSVELAGDLHGGLGVQQQVRAARRHARHRHGDQLRDAAGAGAAQPGAVRRRR